MADLDTAGTHAVDLRHVLLELRGIVLFGRSGIFRCAGAYPRSEITLVVNIGSRSIKGEQIFVTENFALTGISQDDELVREIAPDGTGVGGHGN